MLQRLEVELAEHKQEVELVSQQARELLKSQPQTESSASEDEIRANWRTLSRQLSEKKFQLSQDLERAKPQVQVFFILTMEHCRSHFNYVQGKFTI